MIVVIQCAARKQANAGHLRTGDGRNVLFVAEPASAPVSNGLFYARPDDLSDKGVTWRKALLDYNRNPGSNPLGLCRAIDLYANPAYARIAERFGIDRTFVLSAGWGLINGAFLAPNYDITFSMSAEPYKRRRKHDLYSDLRMLPDRTDEPVVFFGGRDYVPLFVELTQSIESRRIVFYNSEIIPAAPDCSLIRYRTKTKTNWHYECANAFLRGEIPTV